MYAMTINLIRFKSGTTRGRPRYSCPYANVGCAFVCPSQHHIRPVEVIYSHSQYVCHHYAEARLEILA